MRPGLLMLIMTVVLVAFSPLLTAEFVRFDDPYTLHQNPRMNPPSWETVAAYWGDWRTGEAGLYVPLTYTAWSALAVVARTGQPDAAGIQLNPWVFHTANVIVHAASAVLVFAILRRLRIDPAASLVGALLFAIHPIQVEAVAWASGLKDLLAAMFSLATIFLYLTAAQCRFPRAGPAGGAHEPPGGAPGGGAEQSARGAPPLHAGTEHRAAPARSHPPLRRLPYALALLCALLAMLSKPSAIVVGPICLTLDLLLLRRPVKNALAAAAPMLLLAIPIGAIARSVQEVSLVTALPLWQRAIVAGDALAFYLWKLLVPVRFTFDYGRRPEIVLARPITYAIATVPLLLAIAIFLVRRRFPVVAASAGIFVLALLPVLGLATFQYQLFSTVTDHYAYLAMLGVALLAGWLVSLRRTRSTWIAASVLLALLAARSFAQARVWRDDFSLFAHALKVNPWSFLAHGNLAGAYEQRGDRKQAIAHYRAATEANPDFAPPWAHLVSLYRAAGDDERAAWAQRGLDAARRRRGGRESSS